MSEIIDTEWFDTGLTGFSGQNIGVVLTYNEHDGFKCWIGVGAGVSQDSDSLLIYERGTKLSHDVAKGIWGKRMRAEWIRRNLSSKRPLDKYLYDGQEYSRGKD